MKNSLFFLFFSVLNSVAFAANWNIQNLDTGKSSQDAQIHFCQEDWHRLAQNNNCLTGDIAQAFKDLQILDGCNSHVTKVSYSAQGIHLNVHGPVCVEWEPHPEPNCLKEIIQDVSADFKICDAKEKFFTESSSAVVPFQEDVTVINSPEKIGNMYYSGDVRLNVYRRQAYLFVQLNSFSRKVRLDLEIDPNMEIPEKGSIELKVNQNEVISSEYDSKPSCEADIQGENYALICTAGDNYLLIPSLPVWTLGKGAIGNSIGSYSMEKNDFALKNVKTQKVLKKNADYTSLGELWFKISNNNSFDYCVSGDLNQAASVLKNYSSTFEGLNGAHLNGKTQVLPQGIQFFTEKTQCPVDVVEVDIETYACPVPEVVVVEAPFVLKACR